MRLLPDDPDLGWTPYAWLVYLLPFLAFPAAARGTTPREWALTFAGGAVFLVLYFLGYWLKGPRILWSAAGILALALAFAPYNLAASSLFIYSASFIAHAGPTRLAWKLLGVLLALLALEAWLVPLPALFWIPAGVFSLLIGGISIHQSEVRRTNARLRLAQAEVERLAQTAERERIARDLHDVLGHTLSLITLKSELAGRLVERDPERAGREIREVERISREALREVRAAIAGYRSEGLPAELARARLALEAAGVKLEYLTVPVELDPARETAVALALREAVTNVVRHAGARACRVVLEQTAEETRLAVSDDGRGGSAPEGIGLAAMRERIEGLGGRLERRGGTGTSLVIVLPRRPTAPAAEEAAPLDALRDGLQEKPA